MAARDLLPTAVSFLSVVFVLRGHPERSRGTSLRFSGRRPEPSRAVCGWGRGSDVAFLFELPHGHAAPKRKKDPCPCGSCKGAVFLPFPPRSDSRHEPEADGVRK